MRHGGPQIGTIFQKKIRLTGAGLSNRIAGVCGTQIFAATVSVQFALVPPAFTSSFAS